MPRPAACSNCRQDKLRCDAYSLAPEPCTRCRSRDLTCSIETSFKRIPAKRRLQHLAQEVEDLKQSLSGAARIAVPAPLPEVELSTRSISEPVSMEQDYLESRLTEGSNGQIMIRLGDVMLVHSEVEALFREYFQRYHPIFPVLDPAVTPCSLQRDCPILLWVIVTTAAGSIRPELYTALCDLVPHLISDSFFYQNYSIRPCQALLILCMFPLPTKKSREDVRWIYSGVAMHMATRAGLHTTGSYHEFGKAGSGSAAETDSREMSRTWYCCCYVNATLSAEFGLPSGVPQNALHVGELRRTGLPLDFVHAIQITLGSAKTSILVERTLSTNPPGDETANQFGLLRMLESDLSVLSDSLRTEGTKLGCMAEFSLLMAKLNLYSFGLNLATKSRTSEATHLRLSAFSCSTRLIQLFADTPLVPAPGYGTPIIPSLPMQAYYPRTYWKGLGYACLALLKLSLTNNLPELETIQSEIAVQQAISLIHACSLVKGDELHRIAELIRLLSQEAAEEVIQPQHEVKSRMGASLMYELGLSGVAWMKQQRATEERKDSKNAPHENNPIEGSSRIDADYSDPTMVSGTTDQFLAGSGDLIDGMESMGLDANFWDSSTFNELFAFNAAPGGLAEENTR